MIGTVDDAGTWLEGLINFERRPGFTYARMGLGPIRNLLERLGHPEESLSIVHVAGSKGKGSTCLFAEAILSAAGEHVGTFTSPHLERWTERFRIGGREVDGEALVDAVNVVRPHVEALRAEDPADAPTFFDATTATALLLFARANVSRALLEVGLGGRLDSTNAVHPAVTCVTQIELEHTDKLGGTLAEIATEKSGILKAGVPCVVGDLPAPALDVVAARGRELGAPLRLWGEAFQARSLDGAPSRGGFESTLHYGEPNGFEATAVLHGPGEHPVHNAALAVAAVRCLDAHDDATLVDAVSKGLSAARLPGRLELIDERPYVIVDSAHTERSARALGRVLGEVPATRRHLVLSISQDKDAQTILDALDWQPDVVWLTRAEPIRSMEIRQLEIVVRACAPQAEIRREPDPALAVDRARAALSADDVLCCTGSVYLAGAARRALRGRVA